MMHWLLKFFDQRLGATPRSSKWPEMRRRFLATNPACAVCGDEGGLLEPLQVHHIKPYHLDPSRELDPQNLVTLCDQHHLDIGHLGNFKSYNVTVKEDAKYLLDKRNNRP